MSAIHRIFSALKGGKRMTADEIMEVEYFGSKQTLLGALCDHSTGDSPYLSRQKRIGNGPFEYWINQEADLPDELREIAEGKKSAPPVSRAVAGPSAAAPNASASPAKRATPAPKPILPDSAKKPRNTSEGPAAGDMAAGKPAGPAASASPAAPEVPSFLADRRAAEVKPGAFDYAEVLDDLRYKRFLLDNVINAFEALAGLQ